MLVYQKSTDSPVHRSFRNKAIKVPPFPPFWTVRDCDVLLLNGLLDVSSASNMAMLGIYVIFRGCTKIFDLHV